MEYDILLSDYKHLLKEMIAMIDVLVTDPHNNINIEQHDALLQKKKDLQNKLKGV